MSLQKIVVACLALIPFSCHSTVNVSITKDLTFKNQTSYPVTIQDSTQEKQVVIAPEENATTNIFEVGDDISCHYNTVESEPVKIQILSKEFNINEDDDANLVIEPVSRTKETFSKTKAKVIAWYQQTKEIIKNRLQSNNEQTNNES